MIRQAEPSDLSALAELARRTWSDAFGKTVSAEDEAHELEHTRSESYFAAALRESSILVAEEDRTLVGYVQFGNAEITDVETRPGDQGIQRLYVDSAQQGRGLGRALLRAALDDPRLAGAGRVYITVWERNETAVRLYESFGFRRVGTTRFTIGAEQVEDLVLMLER